MIKGSFANNLFIKYLVIAYTTILVFLSHIYPEKNLNYEYGIFVPKLSA